jgi:hypothetical protein
LVAVLNKPADPRVTSAADGSNQQTISPKRAKKWFSMSISARFRSFLLDNSVRSFFPPELFF